MSKYELLGIRVNSPSRVAYKCQAFASNKATKLHRDLNAGINP
jgi:hypothetical protein